MVIKSDGLKRAEFIGPFVATVLRPKIGLMSSP